MKPELVLDASGSAAVGDYTIRIYATINTNPVITSARYIEVNLIVFVDPCVSTILQPFTVEQFNYDIGQVSAGHVIDPVDDSLTMAGTADCGAKTF